MAKSKGSQDAEAQREPTPSGPAEARRTGWSRWRPYSAAIIGVAAVFAVSAVIGAHVRAGEASEVKVPRGMPSTGPSGLAVPIKPAIPVVVTVFEDFRSPASKAFAAQWQPTFHHLLVTGRAEMAYRLVTQTDATRGGSGSLEAANAAGCAQDQGKKQFQGLVSELWKHQPAVSDDAFADQAYLDRLGRKVKDLQASMFVPCVKSLDHQGWVDASQRDYVRAGLGAVPRIQVNGVTVPMKGLTPAKLEALVKKATERAGMTASPSAPPSARPSASAAPSVPSSMVSPSTAAEPTGTSTSPAGLTSTPPDGTTSTSPLG